MIFNEYFSMRLELCHITTRPPFNMPASLHALDQKIFPPFPLDQYYFQAQSTINSCFIIMNLDGGAKEWSHGGGVSRDYFLCERLYQ